MAKNSYRNIPDEIVAEIEMQQEEFFVETYRGLYQKGAPQATDFIPTFKDVKQQEIIEKRKKCGRMAEVIVSNHRELSLGDYSVSLFSTLEKAIKVLWRNESYKKDHPAIALGPTSEKRGYSVKDKDKHISYYLFDYVSNNPFKDFVTIQEADINE